jgi:hypothetical protein
MPLQRRLWDRMYRSPPSWDLGGPDPVLVEQLDDRVLRGPGRAVDLTVDRGLLMSLFGDRARRAYTGALERLVGPGGDVYQHQWRLPGPPRPGSRAWMLMRTAGVVLGPDELEHRLGAGFDIEVVSDQVEPVDDPGIRRLGIPSVAKTSYWLRRRGLGGH